ncbi:MAG: Crp/Fnr family transcriptional regulator [Synergistaceae bacterium]|nr:Crp/Fnr family transcriptional regulator [Synergistaceae bacterium]
MNRILEIFDVAKKNPLFLGVACSDFERMLNCLSPKTACYKKDDVILMSGDTVNFVYLVLSGGAKLVKEDANGNITIIVELSVSETFGEAFACAAASPSSVSLLASDDTEILFMNYKKIITSCTAACPFHAKLIENMLKMIAKKTLILDQKIEILSKRTTREKLLCFFDIQRGAGRIFTIPFNREELACYLCVDRSAMSNELCKMRDEGLINFQKNRFEIL